MHCTYLTLFVFASFSLKAFADSSPSWFVEPGYSFVVDSSDFVLPTAITFLNKAGEKPTDVLYLVAELRGKIKVVNNDRKVELFGHTPRMYKPPYELPHVEAEIGQTGLCMSHDDTALYSTTVGTKGKNQKQNKIVRWQSTGKTPWQTGKVKQELTEPFANDHTATAHQIGGCVITSDGTLWVGTGDGKTSERSHDRKSSLGKIFRMHLDFSGFEDNPFFDAKDRQGLQSLIYASGLRNPFAIALTKDGNVYVADNGNSVDRLLLVEKGKDYPWDNTDVSLTYNNLLVWPRSIGPSAMLYIEDSKLFPSLNNHLIVLASFRAAIFAIPLDKQSGVLGNPKLLVRPLQHRTAKEIVMTGLALGPDGLYVSVMRTTHRDDKPDAPFVSRSDVMKLLPSSDPHSETEKPVAQILEDANCRGCHKLDGWGNDVAPNLDTITERLEKRLVERPYREKLGEIIANDANLQASYATTFAKIIEREGSLQDRMASWIELKVSEPQFDNKDATMPKLNLPLSHIKKIAAEILKNAHLKAEAESAPTLQERIENYDIRHKVVAKLQGFFLGILLCCVIFFLKRGFWR